MTIGYVSRPRNWFKITILSVLTFCCAVVGFAVFDKYPEIVASWNKTNARKAYNQAAVFIEQKNHSEARNILNNLVSQDPFYVEAWKLLAKSWEAQDYLEACWAYTRAAMLDKTDVQLARSALQNIISHRQHLLGDVIAIELLNMHPADVDLHVLAAQILSENKRFLDAFNVLNEAQQISPGNSVVAREKRALLSRGIGLQSELARQQLADELQSALSEGDLVWLLQANALASLTPSAAPEKRGEALKMLERALEIKPDDWVLKLRWFSLLREFAPERVTREINNLWQESVSSGHPGRQLSAIRMVIDLSGTALNFMRRLTESLRTQPESALVEIQALQAMNGWKEIQTICGLQLDSEKLNPYHRTQFLLWTARAASATSPTSPESQSMVDQARAHVSRQTDPFLALFSATILNQLGMKAEAMPFLNQAAATASGEIRGVALRGLSAIPEMLDSKRLISVLVELHRMYPKDPAVAFQAADVFIKQKFNLPTALAMAEVAYRHDPANILYADVYARALAANNRRSEALSIYQAMPPAAFENVEVRRNMQMLQASGVFTALPATLPAHRTDEESQKFDDQEVIALEELRKMVPRNLAESLPLARRIYGLYPKNRMVVVTYALVLAANGDCDQALQLIDSQTGLLDTANVEVPLEVAQIYLRCQQPGKSLEILDSLDTDSLNPDQKEIHSRLHTAAQNSLLSRR